MGGLFFIKNISNNRLKARNNWNAIFGVIPYDNA